MIAGQSDAQCFSDALSQPYELAHSPRIKQLARFGGAMSGQEYEDHWSKLAYMSHAADDVKNMRFAHRYCSRDLRRPDSGGLGIFIARRLLGQLPSDAGILLITQADNGAGMGFGSRALSTPFEQSGRHDEMNWAGARSPLSLDLVQRLGAVLQINPLNRLLGFVCLQGEADAGDGRNCAELHSAQFFDMVDRLGHQLCDLQAQFLCKHWSRVPWGNVLAPCWRDKPLEAHAEVIRGYLHLSQERPRQVHFLDLGAVEVGMSAENSATYFHDLKRSDSYADVSSLTDTRSSELDKGTLHFSSADYKWEVSGRIAAMLLGHGLKSDDYASFP